MGGRRPAEAHRLFGLGKPRDRCPWARSWWGRAWPRGRGLPEAPSAAPLRPELLSAQLRCCCSGVRGTPPGRDKRLPGESDAFRGSGALFPALSSERVRAWRRDGDCPLWSVCCRNAEGGGARGFRRQVAARLGIWAIGELNHTSPLPRAVASCVAVVETAAEASPGSSHTRSHLTSRLPLSPCSADGNHRAGEGDLPRGSPLAGEGSEAGRLAPAPTRVTPLRRVEPPRLMPRRQLQLPGRYREEGAASWPGATGSRRKGPRAGPLPSCLLPALRTQRLCPCRPTDTSPSGSTH